MTHVCQDQINSVQYNKVLRIFKNKPVGFTVAVSSSQQTLMYVDLKRHINNCQYLCNKNQLDTLFILSLFRQSTSTCFGHICSPSSGGILFFFSNATTCPFVDFVVLPPEHGRSVTDF